MKASTEQSICHVTLSRCHGDTSVYKKKSNNIDVVQNLKFSS